MKIGDVYHDKYYVYLITDIAEKKKGDEYRINDDDWNSAKVRQRFVYMISGRDNIFSRIRNRYEECRDLSFMFKLYKCSCPSCGEYHPNWNELNKILTEKLKETVG